MPKALEKPPPHSNQAVIKLKQTIESNRLADQVGKKKKRPPFYLAVAAWTTKFIFHYYNALDVSSPNMEIFVEVFYKSKQSNHSANKDKYVAFFVSYHGYLVFRPFFL